MRWTSNYGSFSLAVFVLGSGHVLAQDDGKDAQCRLCFNLNLKVHLGHHKILIPETFNLIVA